MKYAGFWRRSGAHLIDFLITNLAAWGIGEAIEAAMYGVYWLIAHFRHLDVKPYGDAFDPMFEQVLSVIVYLAIALPYYVWGTWRYGATPGKRVFRIRVVRMVDGAAISLRDSALRCVGYVASYATFGCGFLMVAFHPQKRGLHDLLAGTVSVIKEG